MARRGPVDWEERSTLLQKAFDPSSSDGAGFALVVVEGPDTGTRFELDGSQVSRPLVGQSPVCQLRLTDPRVSRRHVALELSGDRLRITDLESTNGTVVDGLAIQDAYCRGGELMRIGNTAIRIEQSSAAPGSKLPVIASFGRFVGASTEIRRLYKLCERLAASNVPLVIEGETGTGKEMLAEALHETGPRASKPFVVFDCTAVPPTLVESELFGHERGAFSGAIAPRKGVFEQAHEGTLLIDEIGDLDITLQPKLLRAIERSEIRRVGGERTIRVDVRVLAATRRDLDQLVQAGQFRDDLFHRLAVARIELPPLRRRRGDVAILARHFWTSLGGDEAALTSAALRRWENYPWPGNVRELRNAVARQLALGRLADPTLGGAGTELSRSGDVIQRVLAQRLPLTRARQLLVEEFERRYVEWALAEHGGNVVRAAAASGVARRYFQILRAKSAK